MTSSLMGHRLPTSLIELQELEASDTAPISTNETCTVAMTVLERLSYAAENQFELLVSRKDESISVWVRGSAITQ